MRELPYRTVAADQVFAPSESLLPLPSVPLNARRGEKALQGSALGEIGVAPSTTTFALRQDYFVYIIFSVS